MEAQSKPVPCPRCGAPMNHHADKLIYELQAAPEEVLEEFYRCPHCGAGLAQRQTGITAN